ncbi:hypothetical protein XENTR_v10021133 [Xenopus tropicalis]|nr:hypothetical protein XENTR_v10021133 [Xenopus tropicalis]
MAAGSVGNERRAVSQKALLAVSWAHVTITRGVVPHVFKELGGDELGTEQCGDHFVLVSPELSRLRQLVQM